jgi:hypothetical protein
VAAQNKQSDLRYWRVWLLSGAMGPWPGGDCEKCGAPVKVAPIGCLENHLLYGVLCKECMKEYVTMDRRRKEAFWRR